jgi:uncharacterized membrane protein YbhN (UPF0104 family)
MSAQRIAALAPLALLVVAGEVACRVLRLRAAGKTLGSDVSLGTALRVTLVGDLAAAVTPANAGGEPARLWALRESGLAWPTATLVLALELVTDLVVLGGLVAAVTSESGAALHWPWRSALLLLSAAVAGAAFLCSRAGSGLRARLAAIPRALIAAAPVVARHKASLLGALLAGLGHGLLRFTLLPVLASGLGLHVELRWLLAWQLLACYGLAFTPTPGGSGATEAGFLLFFARLLPRNETILLLVAWRLYSYYVYLAAGGLRLLLKRKEITTTTQRTRRTKEDKALRAPSSMTYLQHQVVGCRGGGAPVAGAALVAVAADRPIQH